jgi:hypothetical protein
MKIIESNWDEFNSYPSVNFYCKHYNEDLHAVIFEGYECLFPFIKNKIVIERPKEIHKLSYEDRNNIVRKKILELVDEKNIISYKKSIDEIHPNCHLYKYLFSNYTKYIIENKKHLFEPSLQDLEKTKKILPNTNKAIVCVNGRNLSKVSQYNYTLEYLIEFLIKSGIYVINCTFDKPNFNYDSDSYWEPHNFIESYNINCSLFSLCNSVITIGNAGGVSTHLMTNCNVIVLGPGGWIDNLEMGYQNESILTARKKYLPQKTIFLPTYRHDINVNNKIILKSILE